ncbi:anti-sigma factor domain-containing protein [Psychrobacillus sp. FSL H8-0483]|uniref:anti-sigma factor domain-containing protein n=1 Tax=Psychrobacillus sp. FSL H8-0483 TaxID=2921389 RepID=UPI00315A53D1
MMHAYRGIVCEKNTNDMIFLTSEGEFVHGIPLVTDPEVGEEVEFHLVTTTNLRRKRMKPFFIGPALIAAVLLVFLVASLIPQTNSAYAYVQVEGDQAIEFGVDGEGNVVSLRSLDEAPNLELQDWEGLPIGIVLAKVVKQIAPKNDELAVTTVYEKQGQAELKKRIDQAVNKISNDHAEKNWSIQESTVQERKEANKNNKSIKKFKQEEQQPPVVEQKIENPKNQQEKQKIPDQSNEIEKEMNTPNPNNNKEKSTPANKQINNHKEKQQENKDQNISPASQQKSENHNNVNSNNKGNNKNNDNGGNKNEHSNKDNNNGNNPNK